MANLFLYTLFATKLICAALGILRWSICKLDVLCVCYLIYTFICKSPAEMSTPIGTVLELRSRANFPCLVKLTSP